MKKNKNAIDILKENLTIILLIAGFIMAWSNLKNDVNVNAKEVAEVRSLVERVIRLEEQEEDLSTDISDIKNDLRDIRNFLNIK